MAKLAHIEPPRLGRAVLLQALAIAAGVLASGFARTRDAPGPVPPRPDPPKQERRIRVVHIKPPPPAPKTPSPAPAPPQSAPPPTAAAPSRPPSPARPSPPPLARIAADSTAVHGVRLRVLVPRSAGELAAHLRNSGGCLVVSRLTGGSAEVVSVLGVEGSRTVELQGPPCGGVPRLVRDAALNDALGDPLGRARAALPGDDLVLQVLLTPVLQQAAQSALRARFGPVSEEEMGRQAAEQGYQLTCFAEPAGAVRCE